MAIEQLIWQADSASDGLAVSGAGEFEDHPVTLAGELGSIATLRRRAEAARGVLGGLLIPLNQIAALFGQETADACTEALRQAQERQEQRTAESSHRPEPLDSDARPAALRSASDPARL